MEKEIFKDIRGYSNYQISNYGRVWSKSRQKYIAQNKQNSGYLYVHIIADNGKDKKELVHRLVAITFLDKEEGKTEVNHIDMNKENNYVDNLEWVSRRENNCKKTDNVIVRKYDKSNNFIEEYSTMALAAESVGGTRSGLYSYFQRKQPFYKGYIFTR